VLLNPNNTSTEVQLKDIQAAARTLGRNIHVLHASTLAIADEVIE
jgi:hypothetical protein